jgi:hypothetical protein
LNTSASASITIKTPDVTSPVVTISSPKNGQQVSKGNLKISASASDASGIAELNLSIDGRILKTCYTTSCASSIQVNSLSNGSHTITANAVDRAGSVPNTSSASVTITK